MALFAKNQCKTLSQGLRKLSYCCIWCSWETITGKTEVNYFQMGEKHGFKKKSLGAWKTVRLSSISQLLLVLKPHECLHKRSDRKLLAHLFHPSQKLWRWFFFSAWHSFFLQNKTLWFWGVRNYREDLVRKVFTALKIPKHCSETKIRREQKAYWR